jgi:hypothetical protein
MGDQEMTKEARPLSTLLRGDGQLPMNIEPESGCYAAANDAPAPKRQKSPGRVAAARRLNESGLRGVGGRTPSHGLRAIEGLLRRGLDPETPLGLIHKERRDGYAQDLGGEGQCSNMELSVADRLADLDIVRALLMAQRERARRMPVRALIDHCSAVTKNVVAFVQAVRVVGPGRRPKDVPDLHDLLADIPQNGERENGQ